MNQPSRFEQFQLADGEPKLTVAEDTKIPNAATITINKEDHTLANMLRAQLLLSPNVLFAGYRVPHPLEPQVVIKVQTDGVQTPIQVVNDACTSLIGTLADIKKHYQNELLKARARDADGEGGQYGQMEGLEGGDYGAF